jgi:hypothetical protein
MASSDASKIWRFTLSICLITAPIVVFYLILVRNAIELPILDDYQNILGVANALSQAHSLISRGAVVLASQNNGYKLIFESAVVWIQYSVVGHVKILPLMILGNAFPLVIFACLALMTKLSPVTDPAKNFLALVPVSLFVFQLQYASALNFASISLQQLTVIAFSIWSIYWICMDRSSAWIAGCVAGILAVASSPNGFFLAPIGILVFLQQRRWSRIAYWTMLFGCLLGAYLYHYAGNPTVTNAGKTGETPAHHVNLSYALSFLGSSAARYSSVVPSLFLGAVLLGIVAWATVRRYYRDNPAVFYSMLFIVITAVAVSALRADQGIAQSLASRYRIYSNLMLALTYICVIEGLLPKLQGQRLFNVALMAAIMVSALFCALSDLGGAHFLHQKKRLLILSYQRDWLGAELGGKETDTGTNPVLERQLRDRVYDVNVPIMRESVRLGVYSPVQNP